MGMQIQKKCFTDLPYPAGAQYVTAQEMFFP
jgi:hypothetical protein